MFTDEKEHRDLIVGAVMTAVVVGGLFWIRSQPIEKPVEEVAEARVEAEALPPQIVEPIGNEEVVYRTTPRARRDSITHVYECERDGQRVLSDQRCGSDAEILEIARSNRMDAQDTRNLYRPTYRATAPRSGSAPGFSSNGSNASVCDSIERRIDAINARMRSKYSGREGEGFRDRLRRLSKQRHEAKCIR